jgi:ADP-ribosylglycohydrolase
MRIDSSGNVGIGKTATATGGRLQVDSATNNATAQFGGNANGMAVLNQGGLTLYTNLSNGNTDTTFVAGNTASTYMAFGNINEDENLVSNVRRNAEKYSLVSEANGALMRVIPIAIWYHDRGYDIIADYAREDAKLSHPNIICQECNAVYAITVACLINNPKDSHSAMTIAEEYVRERCSITVQTWFYDALRENLLFTIDCKKNIGHVKHAFQLAFHFLFYEVPFEEALYETLYRGGDSDTNAAIVCGMMGAYHGNVPIKLAGPVMLFDCTQTKQIRPAEYSVKIAIENLQKNDI